ncbi:hypothetical protein AX14_005170 [Amanita brunnescens Koide BX004]|nr:hypothetical protein AX14_005170 [Amanita brunnescens Koide BX004]
MRIILFSLLLTCSSLCTVPIVQATGVDKNKDDAISSSLAGPILPRAQSRPPPPYGSTYYSFVPRSPDRWRSSRITVTKRAPPSPPPYRYPPSSSRWPAGSERLPSHVRYPYVSPPDPYTSSRRQSFSAHPESDVPPEPWPRRPSVSTQSGYVPPRAPSPPGLSPEPDARSSRRRRPSVSAQSGYVPPRAPSPPDVDRPSRPNQAMSRRARHLLRV